MSAAPKATKQLGTLDKTGAYFQKTIGVLPPLSEEERRAAVAYSARHAKTKDDFLFITEILGLDDAVDAMAGKDWRHAS